jgi:hypothetical protein
VDPDGAPTIKVLVVLGRTPLNKLISQPWPEGEGTLAEANPNLQLTAQVDHASAVTMHGNLELSVGFPTKLVGTVAIGDKLPQSAVARHNMHLPRAWMQTGSPT